MEKKIICPKCGKEEIWKCGKYERETAVSMQKLQNTDCTEENTAAEANTTEVIEMDELFDYIKVKKQDLRNNVGNKKAATNRRL